MYYKLLKKSNYKHTFPSLSWINQYSSLKNIRAGYKPKEVETEENLKRCTEKQPVNESAGNYTLLLPPPNVTGHLHLGHALMCTIQDVLVRWKQFNKFNVVWVPGMDHAGIATQIVVEKSLYKEKSLTRHEIGRESFIKEVWKWKVKKSDRIKADLQRMGSSLDWDKEFFTMDEKQSAAVTEAFIRLFEQNLIYRNESLVNWSCSLESTISDIEIDTIDIDGPTVISVPGYDKPITFGEITNFAYKLCDETEEIIVSTTRPETMLGDVAVAVHPNDPRYTSLKNKINYLWHPFRQEKIPIVFDETVDPEFGTGAVKITPAHDKFDFDLAQRHSLPLLPVIDKQGKVLNNFSRFSGIPRFDARHMIRNELSKLGLLKEIKPHKMQLPICSRSKDVIEYMLKPQWFVRCSEMTHSAICAVENGDIKIHPSHFESEWVRWLSESRDWCISRQLWWGHRVPAYHCTTGTRSLWVAANTSTEAQTKAWKLFKNCSLNDIKVQPDEDVLDTWFSSALLPFSAFGWPKRKKSIQQFYPQDILETGHDILFFWVARMVMLGQKLIGQVPFRNIILHGIICDAQGRKMSKSLGNVIVPDQVIYGAPLEDIQNETLKSFKNGILTKEEMTKSIKDQALQYPKGIPECGTDALRFTFCTYNIKSHFINFDVNECYTNKLFFNKIWQATRYTIGIHEKFNINNKKQMSLKELQNLNDMDKWILSRLANTIATIETAMEEYNFHVATSALKTFFYNNFCDIYLETTKKCTTVENCTVLNFCLSLGLQYMQFFTPFLAQELSQHLMKTMPIDTPSTWANNKLEDEIIKVLNICFAIRQIKSEHRISKKHNPRVHLYIKDESLLQLLAKHRENIETLTLTEDISINLENSNSKIIGKSMSVKSTAGPLCTFYIETNDEFDHTATNSAKQMNDKKQKKIEVELDKLLKTVSNEGYQRAATEKIQTKHKQKIKQLKMELEAIKKIQQC